MMKVRKYGSGKPLVLIHGGPGAPGTLRDLALELRADYMILEPFQRHSSDIPLTVDTHISDLQELILNHTSEPPVLVGHSWGAMLALAFAVQHEALISGLILVGCGTFSPEARTEMKKRVSASMSQSQEFMLRKIMKKQSLSDSDLFNLGQLMNDVYAFCEDRSYHSTLSADAKGYHEAWEDMMRLQNEGVYPQAFSSIRCPVFMIHGIQDPHPMEMIYNDLKKYVKQMKLSGLARCGHNPWREKGARHEFFGCLQRCMQSIEKKENGDQHG